jgi:HTH-like domain
LLAVPRSAVYRKPAEVSAEDLAIMALIDRQYLARPYYGSRRMAAWLATQGHVVNRKRVQRLMRLLGLVAIYQRPNTSKPAAAHRIYPYLLGGLAIERVNQVWFSDVTYIPMAKGFLYLVVIMDWTSRAVLSWRLSNTLGADFCVEALELRHVASAGDRFFSSDRRLKSETNPALVTVSRGVIRIGRRWRIVGGGSSGSAGCHRRHTRADRHAGGDTAPVGPVVAPVIATADRDVPVHRHVSIDVHVSVRREAAVGRYVALKVVAVEIAAIDVPPVDVASAEMGTAAAPMLRQHQRRTVPAADPGTEIPGRYPAPARGWRSRCLGRQQRNWHEVDQ